MPSEDKNLTMGSMSLKILEDLVRPLTHEATLKAVQREKAIRRKYGKEFMAKQAPVLPSSSSSAANGSNGTAKNQKNGTGSGSAPFKQEINGRVAYVKVAGRDIYGNEKQNNNRYFECENCRRKVASSRFASHIERCLSSRNSRRNYNNDSSASPPDSSNKASPNKKRKLDETLPKTQVSKFMDRSRPAQSQPVSRDPSPNIAHRSVSEGPDSFPRKKPVSTS